MTAMSKRNHMFLFKGEQPVIFNYYLFIGITSKEKLLSLYNLFRVVVWKGDSTDIN